MRLYFTTVRRGSSIERGGELVRLNWKTQQVEAVTPIVPTNPLLSDPNPRGNTRGGRGIVRVGNDLIVASYHTLKVYSPDLELRREITHPLFVGLHELHATENGTIWVTATAIDAVFEVELSTGQIVSQFWPREMPQFQQRWKLQPLAIDKDADNRSRFLAREHTTHPSHLHLNAVAISGGHVYVLFNSLGAIVNLNTAEVVIENRSMRGAHNLVIEEDGGTFVSDTLNRNVRVFDLRSRTARSTIRLTSFGPIRTLERQSWLADSITLLLKRMGLKSPMARPLFIRGLDRFDDQLFVGMSPASIACINLSRMELINVYQYSRNVGECIHGLRVFPNGL
jgi:hypothetical protein